ncbi:MAG: thioester reductase domain-containing protein [Planctomycetota bacterium]
MSEAHPDVLTPFFRWAERHPERRLFCFLDRQGQAVEEHSYGGFVERTGDVAAFLERALPKVRVGDRVLLAYPPGLDMIVAFFACVRLGWIPVPVYPPTSHGYDGALAKLNYIAEDCGAAAVLTTRAFYWSMRVNRVRHRIRTWSLRRDAVGALPWVCTGEAPRGGGQGFRAGHSETLFLQYTSGSTRKPRGVRVSHANLIANGDAVVDHLPVGVSWLPQYHDMGLIGYYLFFATKGGTTYGFSPVDFIQRPLLWLETITRVRGTATSAPDFAFAYCLREDKVPTAALERLDLSSLRFLMNAAESVRAPNVRAFLQRFRTAGLRPEAFFSAFGLAEYTLAATNYGRRILSVDPDALAGGRVEATAGGGKELVSCGTPLPGVELRIVDPETREVQADGRVGEIWLAGPSRCAGYWGQPEVSRETFEARLADEPETAWLRTGDLGFVDGGELFHCGRLKDLVILRGQNYYPQDVEAVVQADRRVRAGCCAAFSVVAHEAAEEALVVVAELRDRSQVPDAQALSREVHAALGIAVDRVVFVRARTIQKTSSGKVSRHRVKQAFLAGELAVLADVRPAALGPAEDSGGEVARAVHAVFARFGLLGTEAWTLLDAGLDSLRLVEFAQALKDALAEAGLEDLGEAIAVQSLQQVAIAELGALLEQVAESPSAARLRFKRALVRVAEEQRAFEQELMLRDTKLDFDPAALPRGARGSGRGDGVFLTGGTGFLGPFLLAELLRQLPGRPIHVLVRAGSEEEGRARLLEGLAEVQAEGALPAGWEARIRPVCGDLGRTNLGLTTAAWEDLAEAVDVVYHNGAQVNYLYDYATLRGPNVAGTNEVVRLAMSHRRKQLNLISTTFVFGWSTKEVLWETDPNDDRSLLDFGYSQTKWVAERVVRDAMAQGLEARIFRPALITPSVAGGGGAFDIAVRLLAFMVKHQLTTTAQNQVSFCPADLVARNVVAIAEQPESVGGCFHVTRDDYASMGDVTAILGELGELEFRAFSLERFVPEVTSRCVPGDVLFPLLDFFLRSMDKIAAMEFKRYDNAAYRRFRDRSPEGLADPPLEDVVGGLWRFMKRRGLIDAAVEVGG